MSLSENHQSFLSRYATPDLHYSFEDAPELYLKKSNYVTPDMVNSLTDIKHVNIAARNPNPEVVLAALRHPKEHSFTTHNAARNPNPEVVFAALKHPKADKYTTWYAKNNENPDV